ncbi:MAG: STAS domain-containing protein [Clostridia bacterium]|nr:STAS domain-containing protein [Clostridia bacterium]
MKIKNRVYNNTMYIMFVGELDEYSAGYARNCLEELFSADNFKQVVIDLSELDFMDSTGIGVLIGRYKKLKMQNIPIYICNPNLHIEKIFKMSGLYEIMPKIS